VSSHLKEPDPILAKVEEALGFAGAGESAARVSGALEVVGVSQGGRASLYTRIPRVLRGHGGRGAGAVNVEHGGGCREDA